MTTARLICDGKPLLLGPRIGRGGEGEVYPVADGSGRAVKIFHHPDQAREAKVRAMIASSVASACPDAALPHEVVYANERFAGFTMTQVTGHQPIHELIGASSRRQFFPGADWRFLTRVAVNVARLTAGVHAAGIVIGDINSAGFLVSQQGTVRLIDADSFQIGSHRCRVGMPEYTPAELQGVRFDGIDRTAEHDAFGLAVLLFQILMLGRHPHAGVARGRPIPLDRAIRERRFAFSRIARTGLDPPPHTLQLEDLPRGVQLLFERAFLLDGRSRPTAAEWVNSLSDLEAALIRCPAKPEHVIAPVSTTCAWCRIEHKTTRPLFPERTGAGPPKIPDLYADLRSQVAGVVRNVKQQAGEAIEPPWYIPILKPSKVARKLAAESVSIQRTREVRELTNNAQDKAIEAERALKRWRTDIGIWDIGRLIEELKAGVAALTQLHAREPFLLAIAAAHCLDEQIMEIIAKQPLAGSDLAGVGHAIIERLSRYGIINAADLKRDRLALIPGIGEKRIIALLIWRDSVAVRAEKDVRRSARLLKEIRGKAATKIDQQRAARERLVHSRLTDLSRAVHLVRARAACVDAKLAKALKARDQAEADHVLFSVAGPGAVSAIPPIAAPPSMTSKTRKAKKATSKVKASRTCPRCGAPMVRRWDASSQGQTATHYGCSAYPKCSGTRAVPGRGAKP